MQYTLIALCVLVITATWQGARAATLITLSPSQSAIVFTQQELPIIALDGFDCDRHVYQSDQNYSPIANGLYSNKKQTFGVYDHCYLVPTSKPLTLVSGQTIMHFVSAQSPYTELVLAVHGNGLSVLPEGSYTLKTGGTVHVDAKHRNRRAIQP